MKDSFDGNFSLEKFIDGLYVNECNYKHKALL